MDYEYYWRYYEGVSHKIDEENKLINSRIQNLLVMQTILFAAYFAVNGETNYVECRFVIPFLGIAFSIIMWNSLWISEKAIGFILDWWGIWLEYFCISDKSFPPVWAGDPHKYKYNSNNITDRFMKMVGKYLSYRHSVPFTFMVAWVVIIIVNHVDFAKIKDVCQIII